MKYIIIILLVLSPSIYLSVRGALEDTTPKVEVTEWEIKLEYNKDYYDCYKKELGSERCKLLWKEGDDY